MCSLRLFKHKTEGQKISNRNPPRDWKMKNYKIQSRTSSLCSLLRMLAARNELKGNDDAGYEGDKNQEKKQERNKARQEKNLYARERVSFFTCNNKMTSSIVPILNNDLNCIDTSKHLNLTNLSPSIVSLLSTHS